MAESGRPPSPSQHDDLTASERRLRARHLACFPAYVERPDGELHTAMIHDLSVTGALLLVRTQLAISDFVRLELFVTADVQKSREATARVVRVEKLGPKAVDVWSHKIAVQFEEPLHDYEPEIKALAEKQRQLGLRP